MKVAIFGLGYVGCVSTACLADKNHQIIGVDISKSKVDLVNKGISPIVEPGLGDLIKKGVKNKKIIAVTDLSYAINNSDICVLCVGTPNLPDGSLDISVINLLVKEIGHVLKTHNKFYTISIRSTVMPGTCSLVEKIIEKESGKIANQDFSVILNPEFLREGSAIKDFFSPPFTVISGLSETGREKNKELFAFLDSPIYEPDLKVAEMIKFLNNSFHALKVAFANEVGRFSKNFGINSQDLMHLFLQDTDLNISSKYMMPGLSYGGSCLPKDLKAFNYLANRGHLNLPIFRSIKSSNDEHNNFIIEKIKIKNIRKIGFIGLAFKAKTDDLRFSPCVDIAKALIQKDYKISIYDSNINPTKIFGQNKEYLLKNLPNIDSLMVANIDSLLKNVELVVVVHVVKDLYKNIKNINKDIPILDLIGDDSLKLLNNYEGVAW